MKFYEDMRKIVNEENYLQTSDEEEIIIDIYFDSILEVYRFKWESLLGVSKSLVISNIPSLISPNINTINNQIKDILNAEYYKKEKYSHILELKKEVSEYIDNEAFREIRQRKIDLTIKDISIDIGNYVNKYNETKDLRIKKAINNMAILIKELEK